MTADQLQAIRDRLAAVHTTSVSARAAARIDLIAHAEDDLETLVEAFDKLLERVAGVSRDMLACVERRQTVLQAAPTTGGQSCGPIDYPLRDATCHTLRSVEWWANALDESVKQVTRPK